MLPQPDDLKMEDDQFNIDEYAKWAYNYPYNPPTDDEILEES